ncbi:MAG: hypothetical protein ACE37F_17550 [Nannocystaceae bacterium]|nr:hypothetical protein [bacterium]
MTCSRCEGTITSSWTPDRGPSNNGREIARRFARQVLEDAVRYHRQHRFGFEYRSGSASFAITDAGYARLLSMLPRLDFDANVTTMREGAFASYNQRADRVQFRPENLNRPSASGAMLHELVHALQDMSRFRGLHVEIEATAYMAQALWVAADAGDVQRRLQAQARQPSMGDAGAIYRQAAQVCLDLGLHRAVRTIGRAELAPVEQALRASASYGPFADRTYSANGIAR